MGILRVLLLLITTTTAYAEQSVVAEGTCKQIRLGNSLQNAQCDLIYSHFNNGRILFQFVFKETLVAFAGAEDSQLNPLIYKLKVDAITIGFAATEPRRYQAVGGCLIKLRDEKGEYIKQAKCKASNGIEEAEVLFFGGDKPISKIK